MQELRDVVLCDFCGNIEGLAQKNSEFLLAMCGAILPQQAGCGIETMQGAGGTIQKEKLFTDGELVESVACEANTAAISARIAKILRVRCRSG